MPKSLNPSLSPILKTEGIIKNPMGTFTVETGNLFNYAGKVDYITNACNSIGVMGAGIAWQFMRNKNYAAHCIEYNAISSQLQKVGKVQAFLSAMKETDGTHLIKPMFYGRPKANDAVMMFATKAHVRRDSKMEYLKIGFDLLDADRANDGMTFAMPLLGGGLGGLDPQEVEAYMKERAEKAAYNIILVKPPSREV